MRGIGKLALIGMALPVWGQDGAEFFEKNIRPIFVKSCLSCHSAASTPVMGGLRLDEREAALKGGGRGAAIVPGKPGESLLLKAMLHTAGALKMPPGPKLKDAETALVAQWIQMGAPWGGGKVSAAGGQKFWAFVAPKAGAVPEVKDKSWVRSPVDAFVLAKLEEKGLRPARMADKRTLIRRATYDLTGLPPTPEEVKAFLADDAPDAFAKLVERLLASQRYGEKWGRHWLDVARYADSNGLDENLVYKNAYRYRDYVIAAFNADKPFDRFLTEQLAGDLLPASDDLLTMYERWTATGFLSLGAKMLAEDDPVKMQMDIIDEQIETTMKAFLGLTVGCARCHDHKFDPVTQKDYYALAGIFKSSKTMEHHKVVAKWHEYVLAPKEDRERLAAHEAKVEAKRKEISKISGAENKKLVAEAVGKAGQYLLAAAHVKRDAEVQVAPVESAAGALEREAGSFDAGNVPRKLERKKTNVPEGAKGPYWAEYRVTVAREGEYQLDVLDQEKGAGTADVYVNGVWEKRGAPPVQNRAASPEVDGWSYVAVVKLRAGENVIRLEHGSRFPYFSKLMVAPNTLERAPLNLVQAAARYGVNPGILEQVVEYLEQSNGAAGSVLYAWEVLGTDARLEAWTSPVKGLFAAVKTDSAEAVAGRYGELIARAAAEGEKSEDAGVKALHAFLKEKFGPFRAPENARRYYAAAVREELGRLDEEAKQLEAATPEFPRAMGVREGDKVEDVPVHLRGSHWTLGEKTARGFIQVLAGEGAPAMPADASGRLQLAQWMTAKDHPLTSRVMVNRMWRWHFGRGIVASVDNFGRLGDKPSNQPLLDWLAVRFVEQGWSMKAMHRTMMLTSTYQMSSEYDAKAAEVDPEAESLWRMPRRRLEAEEIRDGIMRASGGLRLETGGSILKYKDRQYVANTSKGGDVDYDKPVRTVYVPVVRSSLYDVLRAFDLPDPTMSSGSRDATVVAPQALFMMNSSVMLQHSMKMAESLLALAGATDEARVREAYERALSRPPTGREVDEALTYVAKFEQEWKGDRKRAWQSFCKSLLASNEFSYLN